jgi:hypothetical protein
MDKIGKKKMARDMGIAGFAKFLPPGSFLFSSCSRTDKFQDIGVLNLFMIACHE